jgi:hypothetical protein
VSIPLGPELERGDGGEELRRRTDLEGSVEFLGAHVIKGVGGAGGERGRGSVRLTLLRYLEGLV